MSVNATLTPTMPSGFQIGDELQLEIFGDVEAPPGWTLCEHDEQTGRKLFKRIVEAGETPSGVPGGRKEG